MQIIKSFTRTIKVNGKPIDAEVSIGWEYDDVDPAGDFDFGDADENAEYLARFERGELIMAVVGVFAKALNSEGCDYLGACHISSDRLATDVLEMADEHGMVNEALKELSGDIARTAKEYAKFA